MSDEKATPAEFLRRYERATASHDLEGTLALIADDAVYWFSNQTAHRGKAAIREVLTRNFEAIQAETYEVRDVTWLATSDEVAACAYAYRWSGRIHGKPASGGGRGTAVIKRVGGEWHVAHEHLSAGPA